MTIKVLASNADQATGLGLPFLDMVTVSALEKWLSF